jgi:hypothetical protein
VIPVAFRLDPEDVAQIADAVAARLLADRVLTIEDLPAGIRRAVGDACRSGGINGASKSGRRWSWRAIPIADWRAIDVYAYAVSRGIELLPVYRCCAFMHAVEPWMLRKSWWLPGGNSRFGQVAWLRRYWPSLYARLCSWMPEARQLA